MRRALRTRTAPTATTAATPTPTRGAVRIEARLIRQRLPIRPKHRLTRRKRLPVGTQARTTRRQRLPVGTKARRTRRQRLPVGSKARTTRQRLTIGAQARAAGRERLAVGTETRTTRQRLAIGTQARTAGRQRLAVGTEARRAGRERLAVGAEARWARDRFAVFAEQHCAVRAAHELSAIAAATSAATTTATFLMRLVRQRLTIGTEHRLARRARRQRLAVRTQTRTTRRQRLPVGTQARTARQRLTIRTETRTTAGATTTATAFGTTRPTRQRLPVRTQARPTTARPTWTTRTTTTTRATRPATTSATTALCGCFAATIFEHGFHRERARQIDHAVFLRLALARTTSAARTTTTGAATSAAATRPSAIAATTPAVTSTGPSATAVSATSAALIAQVDDVTELAANHRGLRRVLELDDAHDADVIELRTREPHRVQQELGFLLVVLEVLHQLRDGLRFELLVGRLARCSSRTTLGTGFRGRRRGLSTGLRSRRPAFSTRVSCQRIALGTGLRGFNGCRVVLGTASIRSLAFGTCLDRLSLRLGGFSCARNFGLRRRRSGSGWRDFTAAAPRWRWDEGLCCLELGRRELGNRDHARLTSRSAACLSANRGTLRHSTSVTDVCRPRCASAPSTDIRAETRFSFVKSATSCVRSVAWGA